MIIKIYGCNIFNLLYMKDNKKPASSINIDQFNKFLSNNATFLSTKYKQYYTKKQFSAKDLDINKTLEFIYDIFGFSKYQSDSKLNNTLQKSLTKNIDEFLIQQAAQKKLPKANIKYNETTAIKLLRYCISNNDMFAVHYDKQQQKMQSSNVQFKQQTEQKQQTSQQQEQQSKSAVQQSENNQTNNEEETQQQKQQIQEQENEFFVPVDQAKQNQIIKKKLKKLFDFYAKQMHGYGGHITFDRINNQCTSLTLGKFMVVCNATNIFNNETVLDKKTVINTFKKIAEGKKSIEVKEFYQLITALHAIDPQVYERLGLNDNKVYQEKKKHLSVAFNTKDASIREKKIYKKLQLPYKLTEHSGKTSDSLRQEIEDKREKEKTLKSSHIHKRQLQSIKFQRKGSQHKNRYYDEKVNISNISKISKNDISNISRVIGDLDEGFINDFIKAEDQDQQWLSQYVLPKKMSKIGINNSPITALKARKLQQFNFDRNKTKIRKQHIINDLHKRVKQLESTDKNQNRNTRMDVKSALKV